MLGAASPEHVVYRDTGCEVAPSCLNCPLTVCRYDLPGGLAGDHRRQRNTELLALHASGAGLKSLCLRFRLSRRAVYRILAAGRFGGRDEDRGV
ncbi:MAG: hypothetical protein ACR2PL_23420 [Dehalococcoidia bacterium]